MRFGIAGAAVVAVVALGVAPAVEAGKKKSRAANEATNAALLQRIEELEAAVRALKEGNSESKAKAPAPTPVAASQPVAAASSAPASAEPAKAVAKPAQIATFDPAEVERALERALVSTGATLLPETQIEFEPFIGYATDETDFPVVIAPGPPVRVGEVREENSGVVGGVSARLGLPYEFQLEATIPVVFRDQSQTLTENNVFLNEGSDSVSGLGDISISLAKTLIAEGEGVPTLIGRLTWDTDSGKDDVNGDLGTGFNELGAELVFVKRQDPLVFVARGGYTHTFEKSNIQPGGEIGLSLETLLALSPDTSLSLGVSYDYQGETEFGNIDIPGSDESRASFLFGGNTVLGRGIVLNVGASAGLTEDAPDFTISTGLSFRVN